MKIEEINIIIIETLTAEHDLRDFDCGDDDLNDFLKKLFHHTILLETYYFFSDGVHKSNSLI